jgi:histidine triad (HIT) family protein
VTDDCPFCAIIHDGAPGEILKDWGDTFALKPRNPVVEGHTLVIPTAHATLAGRHPLSASRAVECATKFAERFSDYNLILNQGHAASQTVEHLHWHVVPRKPSDGLMLPWSPQQHGDQFEQWIRRQRDLHRDDDHGQWSTLDDLLDTYRLHLTTRTPLDRHVCEGQVSGDCDCLEES